MGNDNRAIRFGGRELGSFSVDQLYRMRNRKEIDGTAEFLSERKQQWLPLAGLLSDFSPTPEEKLADLKSTGFTHVKVLGSGVPGRGCKACGAIRNKKFPIEQAPTLPPEGCTCVPWCGCIYIVDEKCMPKE